jgi:hypothetical protein
MSTLTKYLVTAVIVLALTITGMIAAELMVPAQHSKETTSDGVFMLGFFVLFALCIAGLVELDK